MQHRWECQIVLVCGLCPMFTHTYVDPAELNRCHEAAEIGQNYWNILKAKQAKNRRH